MANTVIAAQLFTIREFTRTAKDIAESMRKIRRLGYEAVQISGLGPIDPKELYKILDGEGLSVCATHVDYLDLMAEPEAIMENLKILHCDYTAPGAMPPEYRADADLYRLFAQQISAIARKFRDEGLRLGYHNHSFEFERFNGCTGYDILVNETDKEVVFMELDTYWVQHGGGDPADWIRRLKGRVPVIHVKDMEIRDGKQTFAPVGEGNLNWQSIMEASKEAGVEWYCVEQDTCVGDPFDCLGVSYCNLRKMGLQ